MAWLGVAETDAAAGTWATAEILFSLDPGMTTSLTSFVYSARNVPGAAYLINQAVNELCPAL